MGEICAAVQVILVEQHMQVRLRVEPVRQPADPLAVSVGFSRVRDEYLGSVVAAVEDDCCLARNPTGKKNVPTNVPTFAPYPARIATLRKSRRMRTLRFKHLAILVAHTGFEPVLLP